LTKKQNAVKLNNRTLQLKRGKTMADVDYYTLLGISRNASPEQIKKAFHQKAREYHPDRAGHKSTEAFRLIAKAYETLSDQQKRQAYDLGFMPVVSIRDLYERHPEGKKVMAIMLPSAPAAKQIGLDLFMVVKVNKQLMTHGGNIILELSNHEPIVLEIPQNSQLRPWCRLPHLGTSGKNGADAGSLWLKLELEEEE